MLDFVILFPLNPKAIYQQIAALHTVTFYSQWVCLKECHMENPTTANCVECMAMQCLGEIWSPEVEALICKQSQQSLEHIPVSPLNSYKYIQRVS